MKRILYVGVLAALGLCAWLMMAQPAGDPMIEGFRKVEVASVADAMEQLYGGQRAYMSQRCARCRRRSSRGRR